MVHWYCLLEAFILCSGKISVKRPIKPAVSNACNGIVFAKTLIMVAKSIFRVPTNFAKMLLLFVSFACLASLFFKLLLSTVYIHHN